MNKVVKCKIETCGQYFMHTEEDTKCPFCHTEYNQVAEEPKMRKVPIKTQKESFKVWKDEDAN